MTKLGVANHALGVNRMQESSRIRRETFANMRDFLLEYAMLTGREVFLQFVCKEQCMRTTLKLAAVGAIACTLFTATLVSAEVKGLTKGNPDLKSAGPLAFGPEGVLIVGDTKGAAVFAIDTGDAKAAKEKTEINVEGLNKKLAEALGAGPGEVTVNDLAVNPASGNVYVSLNVGGKPAIARVDGKGAVSTVALENVAFSKATLADAPEDKEVESRGRVRNPRDETITDVAFVNGEIYVSGRSSTDSPSTVRSLAFPPQASDRGISLEIFHGAHGRQEADAIVRTFVAMDIGGKPHVLAGFTCTPLVKFPVEKLDSNEKVKGTTVAELGNRNQPYDMITYEQEGKTYLLIANSARGVMKVSTVDIERQEGITERVSGTAGQKYETIESLAGTKQLDKLDDARAVVLIETTDGSQNLKTVDLP